MEKWREELYHSAKGSTWKKHKYIAIKDGRYIYGHDIPEKASYGAGYAKWIDKMYYSKRNSSKLTGDMYYSQGRTGVKGGRNERYGLSTAITKDGNLVNRSMAGLSARSRNKTSNPTSLQDQRRFDRMPSQQARANRSTVTAQNTNSHAAGVIHSTISKIGNAAVSAVSSVASKGKSIVDSVLKKLKR